MRLHHSSRRARRGIAATVSAVALAGTVLLAAPAVAADPPPAPFTFVVVPDTQGYTKSVANHPIMGEQTQWIVDSRANLNTAFVSGLGDIVEYQDNDQNWAYGSQYWGTLDAAGVPSSVVPGNHDMDLTVGGLSHFWNWFPVSRFANNTWTPSTATYGGYLGQNQFGPDAIDRQDADSYALFSAGGMDFLVLSLEYAPPDAAVDWARRVLAAYPDRRAILVTHSFLDLSGQRSTQVLRADGGNSGVDLWTKLVSSSCSIFMVVSGHFHSGDLGEARRTDPNSCGKPVFQIVSDYQTRANGGNGWLRYYTFYPATNEIRAFTYTPHLGQYETDDDSQFTLPYAMTGDPVITPTALASDAFARTSSSGWGTADVGGPWAVAGTASRYTVSGGVGQQASPPGSTLTSTLGTLTSTATDVQTTVALDRIPNTAAYLTVAGRVIATQDYAARLKIQPTGAVLLQASRSGATSAYVSLPGVTLTPGAKLHVRVQVEGTAPTAMRARAWLDGAAEPTTWQSVASDSTVGMQVAGGVRVSTYAGGTTTGGSLVASFDDFVVTQIGAPPPPPPPPPNQLPVASFTATPTGLTVAFDSTASTDPDGTVEGWAWTFGDGGTASTPTPSHTYTAAGTYPVVLTVTDDDGGTGSTTQQVVVSDVPPPPPNQPPQPSFTATPTDLTLAVDSTASVDPDGTIVSRAWTFGDGGTATTVTASHTYTVGGTYPVVLTVTDDGGATASTTQQVTVTAPPPPPPTTLASDAFSRTVTGGWGTADVGGAWTLNAATRFSVSAGAGRVQDPSGSTLTAALPTVSSSATDLHATVSYAAQPDTTTYLSFSGRVVGTTDYTARLKVLATGVTQLNLLSGSTVLAASTLPAGTFGPGITLHVRLQVQGTSPTTLRVRVWRDGTPEPTTWAHTVTDATGALQAAGSVRLSTYLSAGATTGALAVTYDDVQVTRLG